MVPIHIEKHPRREVLRWFGVSVAAFFALVGAIAQFRFEAENLAHASWLVGAIYGTAFYAVPRAQRTLYLAWMYATAPLGWVLLNTILLTLYYAILVPLGFGLWMVGYDPMAKRAKSKARESFWVKHEGGKPLDRYFAQY